MKIKKSPFCSPFYIWSGVCAIFYASHITPLHSHNTLQLVFDIKGTFLMRMINTDWKEYKSVVIRDNVIHQLNTNKSTQLILYIDKATDIAKHLQKTFLLDLDSCKLPIDIRMMDEENLLEGLLVNPDSSRFKLFVKLLLNKLTSTEQSVVTDERYVSIMQLIEQTDIEMLSIDYLASKVFLSSSRLRAVFKKGRGMPLHRYIVWCKIIWVINELKNGSVIQDAVFKAGFIDGSHFNKMLVKMFGISPSQFLKDNSDFKTIICEESPLDINTKLHSFNE